MLEQRHPVWSRTLGIWLPAVVLLFLPLSLMRANELDQTPQLRLNLGPHEAPVRALAFSGDGQILYSAGEDKVVRGWQLPAGGAPLPAVWQPARSIRWDLEPGLRGTIYGLTASPASDEIAVAGVSYSGQVGDLFWANPVTGKFLRTTVGLPNDREEHQYTVSGLAYSPDGQSAASIDLSGRALLWNWPRGAPALQSLQSASGPATGDLRGIAFLGNRYVAAAKFAGVKTYGNGQKIDLWDIVRYDTQRHPPAALRLQDALQTPAPHYGRVTAIAASTNGQSLATADAARQLWLWRFAPNGQPQAQLLSKDKLVQSLAFDASGTHLLVGTAAEAGRRAEVQQWNLNNKQATPLVEPVSGTVQAAALHPGGAAWAFAIEGQSAVELRWPGKAGTPVIRSTIHGGQQIFNAAFCYGKTPNGKPLGKYVTLLETSKGKSYYFDPGTLQKLPPPEVASARPFPTDSWPVPLRVAISRANRYDRMTVRQADVAAASTIDLVHHLHGFHSCHCAVIDPRTKRRYLAIGTRTTNAIYLFDLQHPKQPVQVFRGHDSTVTRVGVSQDQRYLVSASIDGTVRYWPLALGQSPVYARWGCEFQPAEGGLTVSDLSDLSVLYKKGVREGDLLRRIEWKNPGQPAPQALEDPRPMREELTKAPHQTPFLLHFARGGKPLREPIQDTPTWEPILSLFLTENDFIAWSPTGYYECSAAGERLLGWHVNNQLTEEPSFFVAEQFGGKYNRPDIIKGLLAAGGLQKAVAVNIIKPPVAPPNKPPVPVVEEIVEEVIPLEQALPPEVAIVKIGDHDITDQTESVSVKEAKLAILATARSRNESYPIKSMEVLLNGSPPQLQARGVQAQFRKQQKTFNIQLTPGRHRIAVRAHIAVDEGEAEQIHGISREIIIEYQPEKAISRLYVLSIGVSQYENPGLESADFADEDAKAIDQLMGSQLTRNLFAVRQRKLLINQQATKANVAKELQWMEDSMQLGDVGIVFFAGHGVKAKEKLFLMPSDGALDRLQETAITEDDLKGFFTRMGGKGNFIFMVDACHAGAFNLNDIGKDLARTDYGVIFLGSAGGQQLAISNPDLRHGIFTKSALEALEGKADNPSDGFVKSNELAFYVVNSVQAILTNLNLAHHQNAVVNISNKSNNNVFPSFTLTEVQRQLAAQFPRKK